MELVLIVCATICGEPHCERISYGMEHPTLCASYGKLRQRMVEKSIEGSEVRFACLEGEKT